MTDCGTGRAREHSWSGITHHLTDLLAVVRLVAVNRAFSTDRLLRHKLAVFQPLMRINLQLPAISTQPFSLTVLVLTIQGDHEGDRFFFGVQNLFFFHEATILAHL